MTVEHQALPTPCFRDTLCIRHEVQTSVVFWSLVIHRVQSPLFFSDRSSKIQRSESRSGFCIAAVLCSLRQHPLLSSEDSFPRAQLASRALSSLPGCGASSCSCCSSTGLRTSPPALGKDRSSQLWCEPWTHTWGALPGGERW